MLNNITKYLTYIAVYATCCTIHQNNLMSAMMVADADTDALNQDLLVFLNVAISTNNVEAIETILSINPALKGKIVTRAEAVRNKNQALAEKTRKSRQTTLSKIRGESAPGGKTLEEQLKAMKLPAKFEAALQKSNYKDAYNALMTDPEGAHQQALKAIGATEREKDEVTKAAAKISNKTK